MQQTSKKTGGLVTLVRWTKTDKDGFDTNAPSGAQTTVIFQKNTPGGETIGTGYIGYQRFYNTDNPPVEQVGGYIWITFSTWNISGLSGNTKIYLNYSRNSLYNISSYESKIGYPNADLISFGWFDNPTVISASGLYLLNKDSAAFGYYSLTKPAGLGISGTVNKTNGAEGAILYASQGFIVDSNHKTITSQSLVSTDPCTLR